MSQLVEVERREHVGWVRLNRPEKRNAMSIEMREQLARSLQELDAEPEIRVVVLAAAGETFCAGMDLKESAADSRHPLLRERLSAQLDAFAKPLIAAVGGQALGGGLELVLACDMRVASRRAIFGLPEVRIGSLPGSGGTQRLIGGIATAVATEMLFTGEPIDAEQALRVGLVSRLFEVDELDVGAGALAESIARNAPLSLRAAKAAVREARAAEANGLALERSLWALLSLSEDREEGRRAFRERRPPRFIGQ